jgi:transcriptional regulator with XRE-family HTH domain
MSTCEINNASRLTAGQPHNGLDGGGQPNTLVFTYDLLIKFHVERRGVDKKGNKRPEQSLKNERCAIEDWFAHHKLSPSDPVGEELGVRFNEWLSDYLTSLEGRSFAEQTISDRKTVVKKLRESFFELKRTSGLSEDFGKALRSLVEMSDWSAESLARKAGVPPRTLRSWVQGTSVPSHHSLKTIRKVERALHLSQGVLSSRLPSAHWLNNPARRCTTQWRSHLSKMRRLKYRLNVFPPQLQEEWDELVRCYTDPEWANACGLETNSEWRVRWNNNQCPTAEFKRSYLRAFFGYLSLPVAASDPRGAGLGFGPENLTLGLLTDSGLVLKFLHFMKGRSASDSFNHGTIEMLSLCKMLTRAGTGYLRQRPEFSAKLPRPVAEGGWSNWCEDNWRKLVKFQSEITQGKKGKNSKKGRKDRVRMTRDPFEPIIDIVRRRQHPITALFDLASSLESLTPLLEKGSKESLAVHYRSLFHIRLISSNPLRGENFSMMTFIPQNHASYERACELYCRSRDKKGQLNFSELFVETTGESNLYQGRDGSWWLRFNERDFKNERVEDIEGGARHRPYDVKIVPSVWPALTEYLFRHRPVLNEALRNTLRQVRAERGLPDLTGEEDLAIMRCPYVFRQGTSSSSR